MLIYVICVRIRPSSTNPLFGTTLVQYTSSINREEWYLIICK